MGRRYGPEDIAELAIQDMTNYRDHPDECSPPWEGSLEDWRHSAAQAGDSDTIRAIDTVPDAAEVYEEAGRRLRDEDFNGLTRDQMRRRLVARRTHR